MVNYGTFEDIMDKMDTLSAPTTVGKETIKYTFNRSLSPHGDLIEGAVHFEDPEDD